MKVSACGLIAHFIALWLPDLNMPIKICICVGLQLQPGSRQDVYKVEFCKTLLQTAAHQASTCSPVQDACDSEGLYASRAHFGFAGGSVLAAVMRPGGSQ